MSTLSKTQKEHDTMHITKEHFQAYERVRQSGEFNMIADSRRARIAAKLSPEAYFKICMDYEDYMRRWPDVRELPQG